MSSCTELCLWLAGYETYAIPVDMTATPPPSPVSHLQQRYDTVKESRDLQGREAEDTRANIELLEKSIADCEISIQRELLHRQLNVQRSRLKCHTERLENEETSLAIISAVMHRVATENGVTEDDFDLDGAVSNLERECLERECLERDSLERERESRYNEDAL